MYEWISNNTECLLYSDKITTDILNNYKPQLIVSYNYKHIITQDVIDYMKGQCINLHISMLPWNRGADPNFWSFIDDTPKGVTIHRIARGLDTGDIIFQKELFFDESQETFLSTYQILQKEIIDLFKSNFQTLLNGNYDAKRQCRTHTHSLERALQIVDAAAESGVDALKLQTYTADTMTIDKSDGEFFIEDSNSLWKGESLYSLYQKAYTPWEWHKAIIDRCKEKGIVCFSTPFDFTAVDFLEELDCPIYKIASFENIDIPLIKRVAQTGKPMIVSTGMASLSELDDLVRTAKENGCLVLTWLKCTSS